MITCPSCAAEYEENSTRFCGRCGSDMRREEPQAGGADPMLGRVVDGRYRILSKLGQGGMGAVYRVEHLAMGKQAAMKLLHPALSQDAELGARFRREAEAVSRLSHPNTVQVFDFGQARGFMYLVMELVRGEDLGAILRRDGPMPFSRARPILIQVCEALAEAHEAGIVHRDLKPENLLVSRGRDGRDIVKVLDFGLAKLRDSEEASQVTARGSLVGTPFYMSPEQIRAESLDARADIYSLGALLYRMVTGEHPFHAATPVAVLTQHLTEPLTLPSVRRPDLDIPPIVDTIVATAMAKAREERYASADALRQALEEAPHASQPAIAIGDGRRRSDRSERADATGPTGTNNQSGEERLRREDIDHYERRLKRRRFVGLTVLPLLLACGAGGFALYRHHNRPRPVDVEAEPNDTPRLANLIGWGLTVRGHIGVAHPAAGSGEGDRDVYRFVTHHPLEVLHADLTGIPQMDLMLEVFDAGGERIAQTDEAGPGDGETLPNVRLDAAGEYYVAVREVWVAGQPPRVDETNWYTLTATWRPLTPTQESEPDDVPGQAVPLVLDQPMRGYAGRMGDVDYYYPRGAGGGTLSGTLSSIEGVDLRIVVLPPGSAFGPPGPLPPGARIFDAGGPGVAEHFEGVPWPVGQAGPILVVERREAVPKGPSPTSPASPPSKESGRARATRPSLDFKSTASHAALIGLDVPYSLTVRLTH